MSSAAVSLSGTLKTEKKGIKNPRTIPTYHPDSRLVVKSAHLLLNMQDLQVPRDAFNRLAGQIFEKRRLADTVAADQAVLVAVDL